MTMFKIRINNIHKHSQQKPICFSSGRSSSYARDDQRLLETVPPKSADILQRISYGDWTDTYVSGSSK